MRWMLLLAACGATEKPLLGPTTGNPQAAWRQQLVASPTYHGTYEVTSPHERDTGTIASDPAARKLHVTKHQALRDGDEHFEGTIEVTIDGTRAFELSEGGGSRVTWRSTLAPIESPDAPFDRMASSIGLFTYGGDLRQLLLDCLDGTLTPTGPHAWKVVRDRAHVLALALARGDLGLVDLHGEVAGLPDACAGATLLATEDGTLRGVRFPGSELVFQLAPGAGGFAISDAAFAQATELPARPWVILRRAVEALRSDPARQQALLSSEAKRSRDLPE